MVKKKRTILSKAFPSSRDTLEIQGESGSTLEGVHIKCCGNLGGGQ